MTTANLALPTPRHTSSSPRKRRPALSTRVSPAGAAVLSVLGSMGAFLFLPCQCSPTSFSPTTQPTRPRMRSIFTIENASSPVIMAYATVSDAPIPTHTA